MGRRQGATGLVALLLAGVVGAQEPPPRSVKPASIHVPHAGGNGNAQAWDGRLFVVVQAHVVDGRLQQGWFVRLLRPEGVAVDADGVPQLGDEACWSPVLPLELDGAPNANLAAGHQTVALAPAPGFAENPFRSEADGRPRPDGTFETYELLVVCVSADAQSQLLGQRRARVVVREPNTPRAAIERAEMLSAFEPYTTASGARVRGIEPTVTFDGQLLVWQGQPANDGNIDVIMYSWNAASGVATGWSTPRCVADMYHVDRDTLVGALRLQDRWPLAQQPLRSNDGHVFAQGEIYRGAYPWVSHDGSEVFHTATIAGTPGTPERARRGGFSVIGRLTNWGLRHIDGPLNPDREKTIRLIVSGSGLAPGFWTPHRASAKRPLPYTAGRPVYPIFGAHYAYYGEVSLEDVADGDYALVLHMNEAITKDPFHPDIARTPDTSGNFSTGLLEQGAAYPQEVERQDVYRGVVGQGIYFNDTGRVHVPEPKGLDGLRDGLTVELFVKRLADLSGDGEDRRRWLLEVPGLCELVLEEDGRVQATVFTDGQARRAGPVGPALPLDRWTHVAFTYAASSGALRVHLDGALAHEQRFTAAPLDARRGAVFVGPNGKRPTAPMVPAGQPILLLDELKVSRVARTADELARSAFRDPARPDLSGRLHVPLPRGLSANDLRVPAGRDTTPGAAELGKQLFFDPRLSRDGTVACSTCHDPARGFSDGLPRGQGLGGRLLDRNTPTVLNRALSTRQFLDGRAGSLEEQALEPIDHPDEMGLGVDQAVAFLNATPDYRAAFQAAFGQPASREALGRALSAFQRTLLSGDSRVDRFEAGDRAALTPAEQRGRVLFANKARCTACHVGSNFTDEAYHATAQSLATSDAGVAKATGRAGDRGKFKTPTLRDVAATAPYLHDGSVGTLEEVVDLYDRGGHRREGRDVEIFPLGLTPDEKADLVAFVRALDGAPANVTPPTLPPGPRGEAAPAPGSSTLRPAALDRPSISYRKNGFLSPNGRVTISSTTAGVTIRYTTDGSEPTPASPAYMGPFVVRSGTRVKARVYLAGRGESPIAETVVRVKRFGVF